MQVTHQNEHVTHAVIGGKQSIEFGISNSAEFFNILSSTMYSDQILAVVREVLCNAWDAHIEAGYTNIPVQVTLTQDKFVIKDFGKGIHHDDMGPIYATYGNSTKKNDGTQTGGFGLGCKAPFAYTDHFEVISCHAGIKTIYTISKSSAQAQGKPGITTIASFPTNETGLQVSIGIKSTNDLHRFKGLVTRIIRNGDMNILVNGQGVTKLGFDATAQNYMVRRWNSEEAFDRVMVRYGNVIYPVKAVAAIEAGYLKVTKFLDKLSAHTRFCVIFQAPPHSIAVTPSRESLSMQDHTVNTLNTLFSGFMAMIDKEFDAACTEIVRETAENAVTEQKIGLLVERHRALISRATAPISPVLANPKEMARQYTCVQYPEGVAFHKGDIKHRITLMKNANLVNTRLADTYLRELNKVKTVFTDRRMKLEENSWLQRKVLAPLLVKLREANLDITRLFTCDPLDINRDSRFSYATNAIPPLAPAYKSCPNHHIAALPYLRNIVVLATAKSTMVDRAFNHPTFKKMGKGFGFLFYHVGMKAGDKAAALEFFQKTGMTVVDLTFRQDWEDEPEKVVPAPRKAPKKGVVSLNQLKFNSNEIALHKYHEEDALRTETPEFVIQVSFRSGSSSYGLGGFGGKASAAIVELFGDKGGVVNSTASFDAWIKKGAKKFKPYLEEKVSEYILNSPTILEHQAFNPKRVVELSKRYPVTALIHSIYQNKVLRKHFKLENNLTELDHKYLSIWHFLVGAGRHYYTRSELVKSTLKALEDIPLDPINQKLVDTLDTSPLLQILDMDELTSLLNNEKTDPANVTKAMSILDTIIKP